MKYLSVSLIVLIHSLVSMPAMSQEADHSTKLSELDFLLGSWKIDAETRLSAQGPWEKTRATSTIRKTLGSSLIEEDFKGVREGKDFYIKTLFAVNNMNNKYQRIFADSGHGVLVDFEGARNKDTIYFDKLWTYANGTTVKLRVAYQVISNNEFMVVSMRMAQDQVEWDTTGKMKYIKIN